MYIIDPSMQDYSDSDSDGGTEQIETGQANIQDMNDVKLYKSYKPSPDQV